MPDFDKLSLSGPKARLLRKYHPISWELYFYRGLRTILPTLGKTIMVNCATCRSNFTEAAAFCPHCGSSTRKPRGFSYVGSIVFAIAIFFVIFVWWTSLQTPPMRNPAPVAQQATDEAASLIERCGSPDLDRVGIPGHSNFGRTLTYRKAQITLAYVPATPDGGWKLQSMVDQKTLKPIPLARATPRLPCLVAK